MKDKLSGKLSFTPEEVADGKMDRFIAVLRENNAEMRLWTDGYCWIVEYIEDIYKQDGREFIAVDENEVVVDEKYVDWKRYDSDGKNE